MEYGDPYGWTLRGPFSSSPFPQVTYTLMVYETKYVKISHFIRQRSVNKYVLDQNY